jgi:hypothetical protein
MHFVRNVTCTLCLLFALAGCATAPTIAEWSSLPGGKEFTQRGPLAEITITPLENIREDNCTAEVEAYFPRAPLTETPLIFAHGLLRGIAQHRDFAAHIASWGVPVYLVGLCSGGWSGGIDEGVKRHAALLQRVADASGAKRVIYGGYSAGGNASRRASIADARSVGYLGLDPVLREFTDGVERPAAFPLAGVFATSASCNLNQIGRRLFQNTPDAMVVEIEHTTHCHFESLTNWLCRLVCGEPTRAEDGQALRNRIAAYAVAYVRWRAGVDASVPALWTNPQPGVKALTK